MKALRCYGCKIYVVVMDSTVGYCDKCNIPLQEDRYLNKELKLEKDEPVKRRYIKKDNKKKKKKQW